MMFSCGKSGHCFGEPGPEKLPFGRRCLLIFVSPNCSFLHRPNLLGLRFRKTGGWFRGHISMHEHLQREIPQRLEAKMSFRIIRFHVLARMSVVTGYTALDSLDNDWWNNPGQRRDDQAVQKDCVSTFHFFAPRFVVSVGKYFGSFRDWFLKHPSL
jgi:hypothetical protein